MKRIIILTLAIILLVPAITFGASVRGYWRDSNHDGIKDTYVQPYQRTNPNNTLRDNYNYPGNYNPNTDRITPGDPYNYERSHQNKSNRYGW